MPTNTIAPFHVLATGHSAEDIDPDSIDANPGRLNVFVSVLTLEAPRTPDAPIEVTLLVRTEVYDKGTQTTRAEVFCEKRSGRLATGGKLPSFSASIAQAWADDEADRLSEQYATFLGGYPGTEDPFYRDFNIVSLQRY